MKVKKDKTLKRTRDAKVGGCVDIKQTLSLRMSAKRERLFDVVRL